MPSTETLDQGVEKAKSKIDKFLAIGEQFSEECRRYEKTGTAPESQASMARRAAQYGLKYYVEEVASFAKRTIKGITEYSVEFNRIPEATVSGLQQSINNVIYDRYFQYFKSNPDSYDGPPNKYDQMEDYIDKYHREYIKIKSTSVYMDGSIIVTVTEYFREATLNTINYCIYDGVNYCSDRINKKTFNSLRDDVVLTID